MAKHDRRSTLFWGYLLLCTGCQSYAPPPAPPPEAIYPDLAPLQQQLMTSAQSVAQSLRTLAKTQGGPESRSALDTAPLITAEGGMGSLASLDWSGPIEPLLQKIATLTNYRLKILGPTPATPILVSIMSPEGEDRVLADILKDASLQANKQARIVVYPELKIMELRYYVS